MILKQSHREYLTLTKDAFGNKLWSKVGELLEILTCAGYECVVIDELKTLPKSEAAEVLKDDSIVTIYYTNPEEGDNPTTIAIVDADAFDECGE